MYINIHPKHYILRESLKNQKDKMSLINKLSKQETSVPRVPFEIIRVSKSRFVENGRKSDHALIVRCIELCTLSSVKSGIPDIIGAAVALTLLSCFANIQYRGLSWHWSKVIEAKM